MKKISKKLNNKNKKILFLGYKKSETSLITYLSKIGHEVWWHNKKINNTLTFDLVISFGYRYIIDKKVLKNNKCLFINLHLSYLPYNKGSHPNFWSFFENTPSGVTIHEINEEVDSGDIIFQKFVNFNKNQTTFKQTYNHLILEIENLFKENVNKIIQNKFKKFKQRGIGSIHFKKNLPDSFKGWDSKINVELKRLDKLHEDKKKYKLKLISKIEKIRTSNNVNWMDILRLLFKESPNEAKSLIRKINSDDNKITNLFEELSK